MTSTVSPRPDSRVSLIAAVALGALACIGQGIYYFMGDEGSGDPSFAIWFASSLGILAGVALALEADPLANPLGQQTTGAAARTKFGLRPIKQGIIVVAIETVVGELLALAALLTGTTDDATILLVPLGIGLLLGTFAVAIGFLVGLMVAWPLIKLFGLLWRAVTGRAVDGVVLSISLLFLTIVAFAITGVFGLNAPDVVGTPTGRGLYQIVELFFTYSGSPTQQALAWIARSLAVVIVLEVIWIRHEAKLRKRAKG